MSYKINRIRIQNLKFFKGEFKLNIAKKHTLIYGENGSGKSSIYWSLYTLFQAHLKPTALEAQKYFNPASSENLRNRFASDTELSGIFVDFVDENNSSVSVEDSSAALSILTPATRNFMAFTAEASDFMNYKFLSALYDFRNSEENNIFELFEKDVFPFLYFRHTLVDINNNPTTNKTAESWWDYIHQTKDTLPKNVRSYNSFNQRAPEYISYNKIVNDFNQEMRYVLDMIQYNANQKIKNIFHLSMEIEFEYEDVVFNKRLSNRSRDQKIHDPKIILKAKMVHPNLQNTSNIVHPQSFFNEAKLSCMALAIRLAILETRPSTGTGYSSVLFIDDLLLSLDMGVRHEVLPVILDYSANRQLFIFTHDRALYHLISAELESRKEKNNWNCLEMYAPDDYSSSLPVVFHSSSHMDKAKTHLRNFEMAACVNALRRECESLLKRLISKNRQYRQDAPEDSGSPIVDLKQLIDIFNNMQAEIGFPNMAPSLNNDRKLIMNPFSHDDVETPFYRRELENIINELENLAKLNRKILVGSKELHTRPYKMKVVNGAYSSECTFTFIDQYSRFTYEGADYYSNPVIAVTVSPDLGRIKTKCYLSMKTVFNELCHIVSLNSATAPAICDCIYNDKGANIK